METVSVFTQLLLAFSTAFVVYQLFKAMQYSKKVLIVLLAWAVITAGLGIMGFYQQNYQMPPRFLFLVGPGLAAVMVLFTTRRGRAFIDKGNLADLTLLHSVRLPVEIVLYQLYAASLVPQIMTFEGSNFDIITGLSAPLVFYFAFKRKSLNVKGLLAWNFAGLLLLFTIMTIAVLSSASPFQQFGFEQPNTGVTYFPFVWLPGIIVPAALFSHLAGIRKLLAAYHAVMPRKVSLKPVH